MSAPSFTTYIGRVVEVVVGEFDLVEEDVLAGPVGARGGGVRVDVEAGGGRQLGLRRADRHPLAARELEPAVAGGGHLQHEEVARVRVQAAHLQAQVREHPPATTTQVCETPVLETGCTLFIA